MGLIRRYWLPALIAAAAAMWAIFVVPHFLWSTSRMHLGDECYVSGYRDPVTGRVVAPGTAQRNAEACLASKHRD